jgi:hypothetical protein
MHTAQKLHLYVIYIILMSGPLDVKFDLLG